MVINIYSDKLYIMKKKLLYGYLSLLFIIYFLWNFIIIPILLFGFLFMFLEVNTKLDLFYYIKLFIWIILSILPSLSIIVSFYNGTRLLVSNKISKHNIYLTFSFFILIIIYFLLYIVYYFIYSFLNLSTIG